MAAILAQEGQDKELVAEVLVDKLGREEQEILLLVDAMNGFNMLSRPGTLWMIRHHCPKLARFAFNCYRHETRLACRQPGRSDLITPSKEDITQVNPLAMALYDISLMPLDKALRTKHPDVLQPWGADDAAMIGLVERLRHA